MMMRYLQFPLFFALGINAAAAGSTMPTHCQSDEYSVVNAWMGPVKATEGGWKNTKQGKLLSLCADKPSEPFEKLSYRYGTPGHVEFETVATPTKKFFVFSRSTSPHTGDDIIFFSNSNYTYYVAIAGGQGSGVSLRVYRDQKLILDRFSGNNADDDYSTGPAEVNFSGLGSPILKLKEPAHQF